jgi:hypothetical protein
MSKFLIENLELLEEVLQLVGKNQSICEEIMRKCRTCPDWEKKPSK